MDAEAAILEWIKPASYKAGADGGLWQSGMAPETWFIRPDTNQVFDDKIFRPESYDFIKVDDQFYFNNDGVFLVVDNTVKEPFGSKELMRLEIQQEDSNDLFWILQPHINPFPQTGIIAAPVQIKKMPHTEWKNYSDSIRRNPSHWDIYFLMEYLGSTFKPLNWTSFPTTLIEKI